MALEDAYIVVYDRRTAQEDGLKITIGGVFTFNEFKSKILQTFGSSDEDFIITTTGRKAISDDESFLEMIEPGDTLYLLKSAAQPLLAPVSEKIEFQPHYDTLIKSGIYEYYASEGHINPIPFAFAELIDNALAATVHNKGSRKIVLSLSFDSTSGTDTICVTDNGKGMTPRQLNDWAIYRLSKFNRTKNTDRLNLFEEALFDDDQAHGNMQSSAPKSLNSDISWFGVGGKQAIFFIGSSTRIVTRPAGSCDVHEFTLSKDEFKRKEANKETIYSGYIRNRSLCDDSHIPKNEEVVRKLIAVEGDADWKSSGFTNVIITGIASAHIPFMKQGFGLWTRQLAHIYHYYIHGPEGNSPISEEKKNVASNIDITVKLQERGKAEIKVNLCDIKDDLESQYICTASDSFEFKVKTDGGSGIVDGCIRYHPFLYDRETFPLDPCGGEPGDVGNEYGVLPARGRRPMFECFWNGRLIPYTFIEDFDWCRVPKKRGSVPNECYYRTSGCLFTNDKFQVSTNKLTFTDLEGKLRDRSALFSRVVLGQEQRAQIHKQYIEWLKHCHKKYDKQIKFLNFIESFLRPDQAGRRATAVTCSAYRVIEWGGKTFKEGQLIRTQRTAPIIYGRIIRFVLNGNFEGDVYAVGGEVEVIQEPTALYGELRCLPLSKLDRDISSATVQHFITEEEGKLPQYIDLSWPEGNKIEIGETRESGVTIGAMRIEIHNRRGETIQKLPTNAGGKRLLMEQRLLHDSNEGRKLREIASHVTTHGRTWPFWFKKMDNIKALGTYIIQLRTVLNDSGTYTYGDGRALPKKEIKFTIREAPPNKFMVGMLESPLRIGEPFDIPLELQDQNGHPSSACEEYAPVLESEGLELSFSDVQYKTHRVIIKDVVGKGIVASHHGKNFTVTVIIPGLDRPSQTMKLRLLPGAARQLRIDSVARDGLEEKVDSDEASEEKYHFDVENMSEVSLGISVTDIVGNVTLQQKMIVQAKFPNNSGISSMTCDCSASGRGVLSGNITVNKLQKVKTIKVHVSVVGNKEIPQICCYFLVRPSTKVAAIEVYYRDPCSKEVEATKVKSGATIHWQAGEVMSNMTYRLLDEAKRVVTLDKKTCSSIKVNWTKNLSLPALARGNLPGVKTPTNVQDKKYCEMSFSGQKSLEFCFNIKPITGEPVSLKCTILGTRDTQIGVMRADPIAISLFDFYGNKLNVCNSQLDLITISGEGLDEEKVELSTEDDSIYLNKIQFNQGPLGSKELCVSYGRNKEIRDYVLLQLVAGTPVTMEVMGWPDYLKPVTVLNGARMQEQIQVQLLDGWGYPTQKKGLKVLLGKDSAVKLSPNPGVVLTDEKGIATFRKFIVTGKRGEYSVQPRAVISRTAIEGPRLKISILPNTETPTAVMVKYDGSIKSVEAGGCWPDFEVTVTSEEGTRVSSKAYLCMAVWKGTPTRDTSVPSNAEFHRTPTPCAGFWMFKDIHSPTTSSSYCICFCVCESQNSRDFSIVSKAVHMSVTPGIPCRLQHRIDPGTPTVSNTGIARTIIREMTLAFYDKYGNLAGQNINGKITLFIEASEQGLKSTEIPMFEGNKSKLEINVIKGKATLKDVSLMENSGGVDGAQYVLFCEITSSQILHQIPPYSLEFLFYNDAVKQTQMSALVKKSDMLKGAIDSYESLFSLHHTLLAALKKTLEEAENRKKQFLRDLKKCSIYLSLTPSLQDIERMIDAAKTEQQLLFDRPRRMCKLKEYPDKSVDILGKIGHLALVEEEDVACVLSWHMMGDMDCLVTFTSKKAQEIHKVTGGSQQLLPLDSIYKKNLPDEGRLLPHMRKGNSKHCDVRGNPTYARNMLQFPKDAENCKIVFGMLLGETLIMDDLETANDYRNMVVKNTYCPTILTRTGERIRTNGKFGGYQNRAVSIDKLRGTVFGSPLPILYHEKTQHIELLTKFKDSVVETDATLLELTNHEASLQTDEMLQKKQEHKNAINRLKEIDKKIGITKQAMPAGPGLTRRAASRPEMDSNTPAKKRKK